MNSDGDEGSPGKLSAVADDDVALELDGCWKRFGSKVALEPTNLRMATGTAVLISGGNGAGKTTLLQVVAGSMRPSGGRRLLRGRGLYLASGDGGRAVQTVGEAVEWAAGIVGGAAQEAIDMAGCKSFAEANVADVSRGQRARLSLAVAVAVAPAVLCLDEPAAHLDEEGDATLSDVVDGLRARDVTVLIAAAGKAARASQGWRQRVDASLRMVEGSLEVVG